MFRRLFLAHLVVLVAALGIFGLVSAGSTREKGIEDLSRGLAAQAELMAAIARASPSPAALQDSTRDLGRRVETRFTVIAPDGAVVADSRADPLTMDNHAVRPEIQRAKAEGRGRDIRYSETVREEMMYFALRLEDGAIVRTSLPITRVNEQLGSLTRGIVVAFGVVGVAGALVAWGMARWTTRPLREIRTVAEAISGGDFTRKAPLGAADEVGSVAAAINRMAEELSVRLQRLEAERGKLEALLASLEEAVVAIDREGRIVHHNAAATTLLGLDASSASLRLWEAARLPGLEEQARRTLDRGVAGRLTVEFGGRSLDLSFAPAAGGAGAVVAARDVTEQRRYDDLRKEFVANVSHELRTPLSLIRGYVETLRDGALTDTQRAPEFLETIERNVARLSALVDDLLEISRLESGRPVAQPRPLETRAFLDKLIETYRPLAARKSQDLQLEASPSPTGIEADPDLLERALGNLLDNAIKYTPDGGRIRLAAFAEGNDTLISVADSGIGIPEKDLPRVFERFYRVDKSRSRELGGTGLGLAIVKHIAQLHGGSVTVRSHAGGGSTFTLRFPARAP
jgi:two-component system phosphate regulon sensor histidine kinase PhoR